MTGAAGDKPEEGNTPMEAKARARYVRITPMKARRVVDLIRGLPADQAQAVLQFAPQAASETVGKILASAIANADHISGLRAGVTGSTSGPATSRSWCPTTPREGTASGTEG
jgi:hypothetical protein